MSEELRDRWSNIPQPPELIEGERCTYVERVQDCGDRADRRVIVGSNPCDVDSEGRISAIYPPIIDPFQMIDDRPNHPQRRIVVLWHGTTDVNFGDRPLHPMSIRAIAQRTAQSHAGMSAERLEQEMCDRFQLPPEAVITERICHANGLHWFIEERLSDRPCSPSQLHTTSRCTSCKYYNGHSGVVCAVHPSGWQSEGDCIDWSDRAS